MARQLAVEVTEYGDWMWTSGDGVSTSRAQECFLDTLRGIYDIDGFGRTSSNDEMGSEHFLPGGHFNARPLKLNESDLKHRFSLARAVVFVEDEGDALTSGIVEELRIVLHVAVKKIHVRLVQSTDSLGAQSIFPFSIEKSTAFGGGPRISPKATKRLTAWVRKREQSDFDRQDLKLLHLQIALAIEDDWHGGEWRTSTEQQERYAQFSPIRLSRDIHLRIVAPNRLAFIADSFAELLCTGDFRLRRGAGLAILCTHSPSIVSAAARRAASDMVKATEYSDILDEFGLFMWHTRGLGWGSVIREIKRRTGFGIAFADK